MARHRAAVAATLVALIAGAHCAAPARGAVPQQLTTSRLAADRDAAVSPGTADATAVATPASGAVAAPAAAASRDAAVTRAPPPVSEFVRVVGGRFVVGCKPWHPVGANVWEMLELGAGAQTWGFSTPANTTGPQLLAAIVDTAAAAGFNVLRALAAGVNKESALATAPGAYSEAAFRGLDYAIATAGARGVRLLLALVTNWGDTGSVDQMVAWAGSAGGHASFFTDARAREVYVGHARALAARVNTVTGVRYADDPAIMGWDLVNEPRATGAGDGTVAAWVKAVAPTVKALFPRHLVTVGEEGFYGRGDAADRRAVNPTSAGDWAAAEGQSFVRDHAGLDFFSIHVWPNNWKEAPTLDAALAFQRRWIDAHAADAAAAGVPLLVEEYGAWLKPDGASTLEARNALYGAALRQVAASAAAGGPVQGILFWSYLPPGSDAPRSEGGDRGLYGVRPTDAAFGAVSRAARALAVAAAAAGTADGCVAQADGRPPPPVAAPCVLFRVRGLPGTGREGPNCSAIIPACLRGTDDCGRGPGDVCRDAGDGGFACSCRWGYARRVDADDGGCAPTAALANLTAAYEWDGPGRRACGGGPVLPWPPAAPGGVAPRPPAPARLEPARAVTLDECLQACEAAAGCASADFNETRGRCLLRGAGGSRRTCADKEGWAVETDQSQVPMLFSDGVYATHFRRAGPVGGA